MSKDKQDFLQEIVENEYKNFYRQTHKETQKNARSILRNTIKSSPPRPLSIPISLTTTEINENSPTISVTLSDETNKILETNSIVPMFMPKLPIVRELISYVPTLKNVATRGHLIGIPYLGDKFNAEDQRLINSISIEPTKQKKLIRKKKLDEKSLENLYKKLRTNQLLNSFTNEQIIDEILDFHRDSTSKEKLLSVANHNENSSIDTDFDELLIKPWCSRFCPRCYTYNCLLHKEGPSYLSLPKQISICYDKQTEPCCSTCYKYERKSNKRTLSPSSNQIGNYSKRQRKSSERLILSSNENILFKNHSLTCLKPIEKRIEFQTKQCNWTLSDRNLFRLFYFICDGDLCLLSKLFDKNRTCQDFYEQFINDSKYFSEQLSLENNSPFTIRQPYKRRMPEGTTRSFLHYIKKNFNRNNKKTETTLKSAYRPCLHDGPCSSDNNLCYCIKMGTFCEKYCNCSIDCPRRFPGCACKASCLFNNCLCCAEGRECDPDLCHSCGASSFHNQLGFSNDSKSENSLLTITNSVRNVRSRTTSNLLSTQSNTFRSCKKLSVNKRRTNSRVSLNSNNSQYSSIKTCSNVGLQRRIHKQILIAESDVAGYGAFLGSSIAHPGDLISEYTGEIISEEEADRRGRLYDKRACSYLFNLDMQHCIDARQFGNKLRFANHSSKANCVPKIKLVNGDYRIGIYAKQVIFQGDELFFEYMYEPHQHQQFIRNERIDHAEQENFRILKRYSDNCVLVQPSYK